MQQQHLGPISRAANPEAGNTLQGREHEWMFRAEEGQWQVAESCRAQRVIIISLRRGEVYGDMNAIKAELSPAVLQLAPLASRAAPRSIPIQSLSDSVGRRTLVAQVLSKPSLFSSILTSVQLNDTLWRSVCTAPQSMLCMLPRWLSCPVPCTNVTDSQHTLARKVATVKPPRV